MTNDKEFEITLPVKRPIPETHNLCKYLVSTGWTYKVNDDSRRKFFFFFKNKHYLFWFVDENGQGIENSASLFFQKLVAISFQEQTEHTDQMIFFEKMLGKINWIDFDWKNQ